MRANPRQLRLLSEMINEWRTIPIDVTMSANLIIRIQEASLKRATECRERKRCMGVNFEIASGKTAFCPDCRRTLVGVVAIHAGSGALPNAWMEHFSSQKTPCHES